MNGTPRITVVMGICNYADTLVEALESLDAQTYNRFKVILCNDDSKEKEFVDWFLNNDFIALRKVGDAGIIERISLVF